jgi:GGDEF domain-containing protein
MSLEGPIVVIAEKENAELIRALRAAGASPVVEASWRGSTDAIAAAKPAAVVISDPDTPSDHAAVEKVQRTIGAAPGPHLPVIACFDGSAGPAIAGALPIAADAAPSHVIARLASALRVRTLHATALRRAAALTVECEDPPVLDDSDPLDEATMIVTGRGRNYPALTTAVGERLGLVGALSVETAAKYLTTRDIDGVVIGDGFSPRAVEALLIALAEDSRFRDLPVALLPPLPTSFDAGRLPNLERFAGHPAEIVERMLPLVRLHAFAARLQRQLAAIEAKGMLDPQTGLFTVAAFLRDLDRAMDEAKERRTAMSLARFTFPATIDRRAGIDAARLVSRMVRSVDFACRIGDGSILLVFAGTALRSAHVVARRIASVLRHTMLTTEGPNGKPVRIDPSVTLAALKPTDTVESLLARVSESVTAAAQ